MAGSSEAGRGLRLLSLDGGGIRGLSELLIIEEIMKRIQSQSNLQQVPRPAEYFDLIGGTSTGGLIAILLGRLGLSAGEAIDVYTRLAERIFSEKKRKWQDGTFKATILESEIKKVVVERLGPERSDARMLEDDDQGQGCKMFVCATPALNVAFRRRFRNYRVRQHEAYNCTIWEAGRATSAAPTFFKRIKIDGEQFVDAGLGCNNPIKEVISEAQLAFGKERKVDCIISIGTGKGGVVGFDKPTGFQKILPLDLVDVLRKMATESSNTAEEMEQRYEDSAHFYFRFDVDQGLQDVGLDEWMQLGAVKTHTIAYTMETNVNRKIDAVVGNLTGVASLQTYNLAQLGGQISSVEAVLARASNIPFPKDHDFVDRGDIMIQIHKKLSYSSARVALHGLGGKGKSQLAIEYAHRVRSQSPQTWVFWIHASNQARMEQGFQQIAGILDLPGRDDPTASIFQIVETWLKDTNEKWLLVVDNADDPIMFSKLAREEKAKEEKAKENLRQFTFPPLVTPHLPHSEKGSILVTSRNEEASLALVGEDKNIIHVGEMNEEESLELLFKKLNERVDRQGAPDLVKALDFIPLAITQAAAFLSRQKGSVSILQYVKNFNENNEKIIHLLKPEFVNTRRDDSAVNSTIATWQISFDHIRENWPSASEMLSLMSFFNYQGIPEFLLYDSQGPALGESINDDFNDDFERRVQILRDYCLISLGEDTSTFRMHRLVQASTQDWLKSHGNHDTLKRTYLRIMSNALPVDIYENWEKCRQLLPHVESVNSRDPTDEYSTVDWARIILTVSRYKAFLGSSGEAEETICSVVERTEKLFGEGHPVTLNALNVLAFILMGQGKLEAAEKTARQLFNRRSLEGVGSADALIYMDLLATVLIKRGQQEEAETILRSVVEISQRELPEDDYDRQQYQNQLALALKRKGEYNEAESIYRQILEKRKERFQESNINTLTVLNNLAFVLIEQGKIREAELIYREVLEKRERLLGPNAPHTIRSRIDLGFLLGDAGRWIEAEIISRQALEEAERVLGNEHPDTFDCLCALAGALRRQEHFTEAEQMFRRAIEGRTRCIGKEHPDTLRAMDNLKAMLRHQRESNKEEHE